MIKNAVFEDYTDLTPKQVQIMNYRYTMISGIIPIVEDKKKLAAAVKRTAEEYGISKPTVRNYLKAYLKDRDKRVLAPVIREAKAMENKYDLTEEFAEIIQGQDRIILYETELTKFAAV